jgi:hypothetical protein
MTSTIRGIFVAISLIAVPAAASAQTLTFEIEADLGPAPAPQRALPPPSPVVVVPAPEPVYVSPSGEEVPRPLPSTRALPPVVVLPPAPPPMRNAELSSATPPEPSEEARGEEDIAVYMGLPVVVERMRLDGFELSFRGPEIQALRGVEIPLEWAGRTALRDPVLGGGGLAFGIRAVEFLRGPELRLTVAGAELDGPWEPMASANPDLELSVRSAIVFRSELALGVQIPIGPVVAYALGRVAVGAASFELGVRDARLGELGTEIVDSVLLEAGVEAGIEFRVALGITLGFAFRAGINQAGGESIGGVFTIGTDSSQVEEESPEE